MLKPENHRSFLIQKSEIQRRSQVQIPREPRLAPFGELDSELPIPLVLPLARSPNSFPRFSDYEKQSGPVWLSRVFLRFSVSAEEIAPDGGVRPVASRLSDFKGD